MSKHLQFLRAEHKWLVGGRVTQSAYYTYIYICVYVCTHMYLYTYIPFYIHIHLCICTSASASLSLPSSHLPVGAFQRQHRLRPRLFAPWLWLRSGGVRSIRYTSMRDPWTVLGRLGVLGSLEALGDTLWILRWPWRSNLVANLRQNGA